MLRAGLSAPLMLMFQEAVDDAYRTSFLSVGIRKSSRTVNLCTYLGRFSDFQMNRNR